MQVGETFQARQALQIRIVELLRVGLKAQAQRLQVRQGRDIQNGIAPLETPDTQTRQLGHRLEAIDAGDSHIRSINVQTRELVESGEFGYAIIRNVYAAEHFEHLQPAQLRHVFHAGIGDSDTPNAKLFERAAFGKRFETSSCRNNPVLSEAQSAGQRASCSAETSAIASFGNRGRESALLHSG